MQALQTFFTNLFTYNEIILIAVYGQAFFVLGLSVALQWRSESRLELARSVPLLAAFGLVFGSALWGDLLIPSQEELLRPNDLTFLELLQLIAMTIGVTFLLHFGLQLNWKRRWTPRVPWLMGTIVVVGLLIAYANKIDPTLLRLRFEQIVRPLFVFPGAMLGAWGLRETASEIEAMELPSHIVTWLRVAGISFGAYAIFGGLLIPLTEEQLKAIHFSFFGIPFAVPRILTMTALAWAMIQALTIFRIEMLRSMAQMARLRALASDRQRIGRELHDGTIQAIYGAGLVIENAVIFMRDDPDNAEKMFRSAMSHLNKTIADVRRYIFELSDEEGQLAETAGILINELREQSGVDIEYRLEGHIPRYPPELRNHLLQIAREGLSNAIKHSEASEIVLSLRGEQDALVLTVTDNGRGLPPAGAFRPGGRGVPNLRARATMVNGMLRVANRPGGGVVLEMVLPHNEKQSEK